MKAMNMLAVGLSMAALAANANISGVEMKQDATSRRVTVTYTLGGTQAMIVTADMLTNDTMSVGGRHLRHLSGDVNRLVQPGTRTFYWFPNKDFDNMDTLSIKAKVTAWLPSTPPDYMVVNLLRSESTKAYEYYADIDAIPEGHQHSLYKTKKMILRKIPSAGVVYRMGSPETELKRDAAREVPHLVTFTNDFWMAIYQMTVGQYQALANGVDYAGADYDLPKYLSGWGETRGSEWPNDPNPGSIVEKFRTATKLNNADCPTDAIYEFSHRAGVDGPVCVKGYAYEVDSLKLYWVGKGKANPVGRLEANAWNLYDMGGNGTVRCLDFYCGGDDFRATFGANYQTQPVVDPIVTSGNGYHVIRGARYNSGVADTRPAHRFWDQWNGEHNAVRITVRID